jgi:general secretion pathway protein A
MFLDFYGLKEQPFGVTPDPRFLFWSQSHREALASLYYGIENDRGFMALIAPPGMGKTTLIFQLLEKLRPSARTAFLFQTQCDSRELLRYLMSDLGCTPEGSDLVAMHSQLNDILAEEARLGRRFVVVIDEAQNLDASVLETIRLLTDFETPGRKLLQIVLAGQPHLEETLAREELSQLRQRISIVCRLAPLAKSEVEQYIAHRLRVAGYDGAALFSPGARSLIAERSGGIPREINNICFNALSLGCASRGRTVGESIVREAISDVELRPAAPRAAVAAGPVRVRLKADHVFGIRVAASLVLIALAAALTWFMSRGSAASPVLEGNRGGPRVIEGSVAAGSVTGVSPVSPGLEPDHGPANPGAGVPAVLQPKDGPEVPPAAEGNSRVSPAVRVEQQQGFQTVIVEAQQTLHEIVPLYLKRPLDPALVREIMRLNPEVVSHDLIKAGSPLRLPVDPVIPSKARGREGEMP